VVLRGNTVFLKRQMSVWTKVRVTVAVHRVRSRTLHCSGIRNLLGK
jgi:hypothetical protein